MTWSEAVHSEGGGDGLALELLPRSSAHRWTPRFAKRSMSGGPEGKDCSHRSGLCVRPMPRSLMESADGALISFSHSKCSGHCRFTPSRSDLSCHHVMIA